MILYTSEHNENRTVNITEKECACRAAVYGGPAWKIFSRYLGAAMLTAMFGAVYEWFSFGVYSYYMLYAFAIPLLGGVLPYYLLLGHPHAQESIRHGGITGHTFWGAGIAVLTVGSIFRGIVEIYGTDSRLSGIYLAAGTVLCICGIAAFLPFPAITGKRAEKD